MRVFELGVASRVPRERADECLVMFSEVADQKDEYEVFYEQFNASKSGNEQNGQNDRYRGTDETIDAVSSSSFREWRKGNYEVLNDKVVLQDFCWLGCASGWRILSQREGANFSSKRIADPVDEYAVHQLKEFDGTDQEFVIKGLSYNVSSVSANVAEDFSVTFELGVAHAEEVVGLASFTSIIQVVSARMFSIDISMITVSSVETTSASAILIAFSVTGSGLSVSTISGGSTRRIGFWRPR